MDPWSGGGERFIRSLHVASPPSTISFGDVLSDCVSRFAAAVL